MTNEKEEKETGVHPISTRFQSDFNPISITFSQVLSEPFHGPVWHRLFLWLFA